MVKNNAVQEEFFDYLVTCLEEMPSELRSKLTAIDVTGTFNVLNSLLVEAVTSGNNVSIVQEGILNV